MKNVVNMRFGSWIYGTNLPSSDMDYKAVYLPSAQDIILQRVKASINHSTKSDKNAKNSSTDIDTETYSLQQYVKLLIEGQTIAIDMLFTPEDFYQSPCSDAWDEIWLNKEKFIHSGYSSFAGYCKQQANKYGIKGSRVAAVRLALDTLKAHPKPHDRLGVISDKFQTLVDSSEHIKLVDVLNKRDQWETYLEVCNRKVGVTCNIKHAIEVFQNIFDEYGARAQQAEKNEGCDWKALMHAVRICNQSKELLSTGNITFPRPEADVLLQIRKGELPYKQVAEMIENGLVEMEAASVSSTLRKEPDFAYAEKLVYDSYIGVVDDALDAITDEQVRIATEAEIARADRSHRYVANSTVAVPSGYIVDEISYTQAQILPPTSRWSFPLTEEADDIEDMDD
jgi:hypothetical protein